METRSHRKPVRSWSPLQKSMDSWSIPQIFRATGSHHVKWMMGTFSPESPRKLMVKTCKNHGFRLRFFLKPTQWINCQFDKSWFTWGLLWCATLLSRLVTPLSYHFLLLSGGQDTFGKWYYCTTGISQHTTDISPRFDQDLTSFNLLWDQIADLLDVIISRWTAVFTMLTAAASLTTTTLIEQLCNQQSLFRQLQTPGTCMYWFWCGIYNMIYIIWYIYIWYIYIYVFIYIYIYM